MGVGLTSAGPPPDDPILMVLDHPFQFFIYDKSEQLMLFEGRLGAPEVPEAEPAMALLDAVHSDPGFWSPLGVDPIEPPAFDDTMTTATTTEEATNLDDPTTTAATMAQDGLTASTTVATSSFKTTVNPTGGATTTSSTVASSSTLGTTTGLPEPEAIVDSSSGSTPNKRYTAMCTSIFLAFASAYVL